MSAANAPVNLKNLLDPARGSFLITDASGTVVYANEGVSRRTGFSLGEVIGQKPGKLWGGHMPRSFYTHLWRTIREEREPFAGKVENVRKNKTVYQEDLFIAPLSSLTGVPTFFLALNPGLSAGETRDFLHDLTELFAPERVLSGRALVRWVSDWYGGEISLSHDNGATALDLVEAVLVSPTREHYAERSADEVLVRAAQVDPQKFHLLYQKYRSLIVGYFLRHLTGDRSTAEELAQDTFYQAFQHLATYELRNATYSTYLLRIAHNLLVNYFRSPRDYSVFLSLNPGEDAAVPLGRSLGWLWEMPGMAPHEGQVLALFYRDGYSVREIATFVGKSENAVKLILSRGRKRLRGLLETRF